MASSDAFKNSKRGNTRGSGFYSVREEKLLIGIDRLETHCRRGNAAAFYQRQLLPRRTIGRAFIIPANQRRSAKGHQGSPSKRVRHRHVWTDQRRVSDQRPLVAYRKAAANHAHASPQHIPLQHRLRLADQRRVSDQRPLVAYRRVPADQRRCCINKNGAAIAAPHRSQADRHTCPAQMDRHMKWQGCRKPDCARMVAARF